MSESIVTLSDITSIKPNVNKVELSELGEGKVVYVKELRGKAIDLIQKEVAKGDSVSQIMLIKQCMCDENGVNILKTGDEAEAFAENIPASIYTKLVKACVEANKFLQAEEVVKEEAKN
jgi:hypothetical protein